MSTPTDTPPVTVAELLDEVTARLDFMATLGIPDRGIYELWRITAHLAAAVRQLAADTHNDAPDRKAEP